MQGDFTVVLLMKVVDCRKEDGYNKTSSKLQTSCWSNSVTQVALTAGSLKKTFRGGYRVLPTIYILNMSFLQYTAIKCGRDGLQCFVNYELQISFYDF